MASARAEDVKRVIPSSGSPYIDAKAVIKHVLPPVDDHDVATKLFVNNAGANAVQNVNGIVDVDGSKITNVGMPFLTDNSSAINGGYLADKFATELDNNDALRVVSGEVDAQSARIKNLADAFLTNQSDAVNVLTAASMISSATSEMVTNNGSAIDAESSRMINLADALMTSQKDAVNVKTMTEQFPSLLDSNDVLRIVSSEVDASSARIKNLADATLSNQKDAVNVGTVKQIFADSALEVDLVTLSELTDSELAISSVNARIVALGTYINRLERAIAAQDIIDLPA